MPPLTGGDGTVCELRKMYLLPEARGKGGGKLIMEACLAGARGGRLRRNVSRDRHVHDHRRAGLP